ncbi:TPA: hypothetical protein ACKPZV_000210 [Stenotrophomonas maltophilia]
MSKFFVGQRVRIVDCQVPGAMCHIGKEGRIVAECEVYEGNWDVDVALCEDDGTRMSWAEEHLIPILPEGSAPSEFTFQQLMDSLQEVMA